MTIHVENIESVTHQPAHFDELTNRIGRGNPQMRRKRHKLDAPATEESVGGDEEGVGPVALEGSKGGLDLAAGARVEHSSLQSEGACRFRYFSQRGFGRRSIGRIDQYGNPHRFGYEVVQQTQSLGPDFRSQKIDTGRIAAWPGEVGDQTQLDRIFGDTEDDRNCRG